MVDLIKNFDAYSLKARVFPALIAGLPALALLFVLVPWDHLGLSHAIAAAMGFVLLFAFSDVARSRGKKIQEKLGRVDKRDSQDVLNVIQAGICDGDQLGTRPDV